MFGNLKLSSKMIVGFTMVLVPFMIAILIYHDAVTSSNKSFQNLMKEDMAIAQYSRDVDIGMLQCRRNEKDFLLRHDKKYSSMFAKDIEGLRKNAQELLALSQKSGNMEIAGKTESIVANVQEYGKAFNQVALSWEERGLDQDSGLQGKFREIVHVLEKSILELSAAEAEVLLLQVRRNEKDYLLRGDQKYVKATVQSLEKLGEALKKIAPPAVISGLDKNIKDYRSSFEALAAKDQKIAADTETMRIAVHKIEPVVAEITDAASKSATAKAEMVNDQVRYETTVAMAVVAGAVLISILLIFLVTRSISKPVIQITKGLTESSDLVSSASSQVSSASQQLAEGSSEQASALEEISSSLEEMSSMTKQNAENANQANLLMSGTNETVARASQSMGQLTTSMGEISKASEETSKIIRTIDEIAFQTNLLALNAAVEAARAGEAGAGFAVVADEVRNLAMRAAEAAKNTAVLIEGTVRKVSEGSQVVERTNNEFREVAGSVEKSGELVGEITAASLEQAEGIAQISKAVSEMDKVVQQNAANAEESAAASEELNSQAQQMTFFTGDLKSLIDGNSSGRKGTAVPGEKNARNSAKALTSPANKETALEYRAWN